MQHQIHTRQHHVHRGTAGPACCLRPARTWHAPLRQQQLHLSAPHHHPGVDAAQWSPAAARHTTRAAASTETTTGGQVEVQGACYEDVIAALARRALAAAQALPAGAKHIVGIAGAPGSGKSTLAARVQQEINRLAGGERLAALLPMDGFHYYKRELDAMPDPKLAHAQRGAPFTFNAPAFVAAVRRVRLEGRARVPSFDHGVGDPKEDALDITLDNRVVLVEGNYVLLDEAPWSELRALFDDTWFVSVPLDVAMDRVYRRQTSHGVQPEVSRRRVATNDRPNGELVNAQSPKHARVLVPSSIPFRG